MPRIEIEDLRPKYDAEAAERAKFRGEMNFDHPHEKPRTPEIYGELMRIPIWDSRGTLEFVLIDLKDWPKVQEYGPWRLEFLNGKLYATHRYTGGGRAYLHKLVANAWGGQRVRFLNGNTLDCRRENLKIGGN